MSIISNTIIAFCMSADAFAASIGIGVALRKPKWSHAMKIGLVFGGVEAATPVIGWLLGIMASGFMASVDHWVAFAILSLIGGKMIHEGFQNKETERKESHTFGLLFLTAIGTSMDAMAVGATLALLNVNIWIMAAMIGAATFLMSTLGIMTGHYIRTKAGKIAEVLGGSCLIAIGVTILAEHLGA